MTKPDRIPCINPRCGRTAPADKYDPGSEIICGRCFRALPPRLRRAYRIHKQREKRVLRRIDRRIAEGTISAETVERLRRAFERAGTRVWNDIRAAVVAPDRPAGLDTFLEEMRLT